MAWELGLFGLGNNTVALITKKLQKNFKKGIAFFEIFCYSIVRGLGEAPPVITNFSPNS